MLTIGALAKRTGTQVPTIRYYEQIGLMPAPDRSGGGQRRYRESDLDRLAFIRHSRDLGFGLDAIRELLDMSDRPDRSCADVDEIARRHLAEVERRIARLATLKEELDRMLSECGEGRVSDCRVLEVLRDHSECLTSHSK